MNTTNFYTPNRYYQKKGAVLDKYVFLGDTLVATIEFKNSTITPRYAHVDHLNSTALMSNTAGSQVQLLDYYPFGQTRQNVLNGSFDSRRKYATHELDDDTGFDYVKARYYVGDKGRFQSQDKLFLFLGNEILVKSLGIDQNTLLSNPQTLNSYSYALNNPVTILDANGNCPICVAAVILVGTLANYAPQITSYVESLSTPLGQYGISQAIEDAHNGNYLMAALGIATAGTASEVRGTNIMVKNSAGELSNVFRAGDITFNPNDFRKTLTNGIINPSLVNTAEGISVNANRAAVETLSNTKGYGGKITPILSLPKGLELIQSGNNLDHYIIRPTSMISVEEFQGLINKMNSRIQSLMAE